MKKQTVITVILAAVFIVILAGAGFLYGILGKDAPDNLSADTAKTALKPAPDFTAIDADGNEHKLSDYFGTPIVLNFWASWCGPCKMEMPHFESAYQTYNGDIKFLVVNMTDGSRETVDDASSYIEDMGYTFPVLYDTQSDAAITYAVTALPITYFIDSEGNLVAQATGAIDADKLERGIGMIYSEQ